MTANGERHEAMIPADYSRSAFHLQYYVALQEGDRLSLSPGFAGDLANVTYGVILQA